VIESDPVGYLSTTPNEVDKVVTLGNSYEVNFGDVLAAACTCPPDSHEDDDALAQAVVLGLGVSQTHDFCDDATDWTRFTAQAGHTYTATTSAGGPDWYWGRRADTNLEILDARGNVLAANDDYEGTDDYSSQVVWQARKSGNYYLRTTNRAGLSGCLTDYQVQLEQSELASFLLYLTMILRNYQPQTVTGQGPDPALTEVEQAATEQAPQGPFSITGVISHTSCADDYEIDDTWELAHDLEFGVAQVHSFDSDPWLYSADKDFVWFDLKAGEIVTFTVTPVNETGTVLELYDGQGVAVGVTGTTRLVWLANETGRFYLSVSPEPQATTSGCADEVGYELLPEIRPLSIIYLSIILRSFAP